MNDEEKGIRWQDIDMVAYLKEALERANAWAKDQGDKCSAARRQGAYEATIVEKQKKDLYDKECIIEGQKDHIRRLENRPLTPEVEHYSQRLAFAETFITNVGMSDLYAWTRSLADARS